MFHFDNWNIGFALVLRSLVAWNLENNGGNVLPTQTTQINSLLQKWKVLKSALYTLYCSSILPYMTYCVEVLGNTYKTNTDPIFILQKWAIRIRIVNKTSYREPTNPFFIRLKALMSKDPVWLENYSNHVQNQKPTVAKLYPTDDPSEVNTISERNIHVEVSAKK